MFSESEYQLIWLTYALAALGISLSLGWFLSWVSYKPLITFLRVSTLVGLLIPVTAVEGQARMAPLLSFLFDALLVSEPDVQTVLYALLLSACAGLLALIMHQLSLQWRRRESTPASASDPRKTRGTSGKPI